MTRRFFPTVVLAALTLSLTGVVAATQDAVSVNPEAYRLEFENAWVKVVRVTYGPNAEIAPHLHTARASAYVYLNDGGPILFKHEGLPYAGVTRPPTKAGSFRVYKGLNEVHSVENPTTTPSEFLRVEFQTEPLEEASLKGKFFRDEAALSETIERTQFENAQVRITRVRVLAGDSLDLATGGGQPALLVALTAAGIAAPTSAVARLVDAGKTVWLDAGRSFGIRPVGVPAEVLRFDFKTAPMESR